LAGHALPAHSLVAQALRCLRLQSSMVAAPPPATLQALGGRIAALVLNFPERRNAMSSRMVEALRDCVAQLQAQAEARECHGVLLRSDVPGKRPASSA